MKFYVSITVHQNDSCAPDYLKLHLLLGEAGFVQRGLDGARTERPSSGLYAREDAVLGRSDIEFDLQCVLRTFPHRCSFTIDEVLDTRVPLRSRATQDSPVRPGDAVAAHFASFH